MNEKSMEAYRASCVVTATDCKGHIERISVGTGYDSAFMRLALSICKQGEAPINPQDSMENWKQLNRNLEHILQILESIKVDRDIFINGVRSLRSNGYCLYPVVTKRGDARRVIKSKLLSATLKKIDSRVSCHSVLTYLLRDIKGLVQSAQV